MTAEHTDTGDGNDSSDDVLPDDVADEAERLTRLARRAVDEDEAAVYREDRDALLVEYGYTARIRNDDDGDVLVCYPAEWVEDGVVRVEAVEDVDRGVERPLDAAGDADDWDEVDAHNRAIAEAVAADYGEVHGANAAAFADFMSNHYARPIDSASPAEIEEFLSEYYPRNAWPTDEQRDVVEKSVKLTLETAGGNSSTGPLR